MELCDGGELFESIIRNRRYPEAEAARVIRAVISAVHYMHSNGIVHGDIKPENVVLLSADSRTKVRVVDFGQAARCQPGEPLSQPGKTLFRRLLELRTLAVGDAHIGWTMDALHY